MIHPPENPWSRSIVWNVAKISSFLVLSAGSTTVGGWHHPPSSTLLTLTPNEHAILQRRLFIAELGDTPSNQKRPSSYTNEPNFGGPSSYNNEPSIGGHVKSPTESIFHKKKPIEQSPRVTGKPSNFSNRDHFSLFDFS